MCTKRVNRPQAEGKNRGQEQEYDAKYMHHSIPGIAVVFHVIRKLALEIGIHNGLVTALACGKHPQKPTS